MDNSTPVHHWFILYVAFKQFSTSNNDPYPSVCIGGEVEVKTARRGLRGYEQFLLPSQNTGIVAKSSPKITFSPPFPG